MNKLSEPLQKNLSGIEALQLLQKGHMVRRSCWVNNFFIRICNEAGFDKDGKAVIQVIGERQEIPLYTHATNGYFMHLGHSSQPFAFQHTSREGEGIGMLFMDDWEDYGFISSKDFDRLTEIIKEKVRKLERSFLKIID